MVSYHYALGVFCAGLKYAYQSRDHTALGACLKFLGSIIHVKEFGLDYASTFVKVQTLCLLALNLYLQKSLAGDQGVIQPHQMKVVCYFLLLFEKMA